VPPDAKGRVNPDGYAFAHESRGALAAQTVRFERWKAEELAYLLSRGQRAGGGSRQRRAGAACATRTRSATTIVVQVASHLATDSSRSLERRRAQMLRAPDVATQILRVLVASLRSCRCATAARSLQLRLQHGEKGDDR
jgi:hypothetical protein